MGRVLRAKGDAGMTHLFVSHSSRDQRAADLVRASLVSAGFQSLFLDFDPDVGIPGGRDWERELYDQLHTSDGLILIATSASLNSHWCLAEVALARSLGVPVFPLRVERGVSWPLLDGVQWIDLGDPQVGVPGWWRRCGRPVWIGPGRSPGMRGVPLIRVWRRSPQTTRRCSSGATGRSIG
jgi:TIR domain